MHKAVDNPVDAGAKEHLLQVGKTYVVTMDDCCIEGTFMAKLTVLSWDSDGPDDIHNIEEMRFNNGIVLTRAVGCVFEKIEKKS